MRIFIARHAIAEDQANNDAARRLTEEGRRQADQMGKVIKATLAAAPSEIWTSPLVRCRETAEAAGAAMGYAGEIKVVKDLSPGAEPEKILYLCGRAKKASVMVVGHAPDVAMLAARVLGFKTEHRMHKGALCIVDIEDPQRPPGRSVATLEAKEYGAILKGETYVPWSQKGLSATR